jgi:hypothetical protein
MTPARYLRAALPALTIELILFGGVRGLPISSQPTLVGLSLISWVVLPVLVGFRVSRFGGSRLEACLGGVTISMVTLLCAAITELLTTQDPLAFGGFVQSVFLFAVPIQAIFGLVGSWAATRRASHGA